MGITQNVTSLSLLLAFTIVTLNHIKQAWMDPVFSSGVIHVSSFRKSGQA